MTYISNLAIGRKIGLVLGGIVLLLIGLSALSLWGIRTTERLAQNSIDRLTAVKLAEKISGQTAVIGLNVAQMVVVKKASADTLNMNADLPKTRNAALADFRARADSPKSINLPRFSNGSIWSEESRPRKVNLQNLPNASAENCANQYVRVKNHHFRFEPFAAGDALP